MTKIKIEDNLFGFFLMQNFATLNAGRCVLPEDAYKCERHEAYIAVWWMKHTPVYGWERDMAGFNNVSAVPEK